MCRNEEFISININCKGFPWGGALTMKSHFCCFILRKLSGIWSEIAGVHFSFVWNSKNSKNPNPDP